MARLHGATAATPTPELWLSDGWAAVQAEAGTRRYWERHDGDWSSSRWRRRPVDPRRRCATSASTRPTPSHAGPARGCRPRPSGNVAARAGAARATPSATSGNGRVSAYPPYPGFAACAAPSASTTASSCSTRWSCAAPARRRRTSGRTYRNFFTAGALAVQRRAARQGWEARMNALARSALRISTLERSRRTASRDDVVAGLSRPQKSLPSRSGSTTRRARACSRRSPAARVLSDPHRALDPAAPRARMAAESPPGAALVEFGSGSSTKTRLLLDAAPQIAGYVPVDISARVCARGRRSCAGPIPRITVPPLVGDFTADSAAACGPRAAARRLLPRLDHRQLRAAAGRPLPAHGRPAARAPAPCWSASTW